MNCGAGEDSLESFGLQGDQTVNSKENKPWIFIGITDAEAEVQIHWPSDAKNWFIGKKSWCSEKLKANGERSSRGWDS